MKRNIMPRIRDFNYDSLNEFFSERLRVTQSPKFSFRGKATQYIIFLPRWFIRHGQREPVCTGRDELLLTRLLFNHFGGYTVDPSYPRGLGKRGIHYEENLHRKITVIASRWRGTMRYFQALRKELEECSGEEQILILRQELAIV